MESVTATISLLLMFSTLGKHKRAFEQTDHYQQVLLHVKIRGWLEVRISGRPQQEMSRQKEILTSCFQGMKKPNNLINHNQGLFHTE